MAGCEDFIKPDAPSAFTSNYIFSDVGNAKRAVSSMYALFTEDPYTSRMSTGWSQNSDVETSEVKGSTPADKTDNNSLQRGRLQSYKDNLSAWENNYLAVDRANQCIEGILASKIATEKEMQHLLAECYVLRAYRYLMLTQIWGDVPYFRKAATYGDNLDIPRTDKNIIYSMSLQDLINCEEKLNFADNIAGGIERINREFTLGLVAKIALFRAGYSMNYDGTMKRADDYRSDISTNDSLAVKYSYNGVEKTARTNKEYFQLAKDYSEKLMTLKDRQLNSSFAQIFMNECQFITPANDDVLYEVAYGPTASGGDVGWCIGVGVKASSKGVTGLAVGISPAYYFTFDSKDIRRDVTVNKIEYTNETTQAVLKYPSYFGVAKWNRLWLPSSSSASSTSSKGTGINWPLMRYSDVLLMYAEAENELNGPTSSAKEALRRVRNRAFASENRAVKVEHYIDSVSVDKTGFFNAIVNERAWEFGGECTRKYDLVRWNLYAKRIDETIIMLRNICKASLGVELTDPEVSKYAGYADKLYYKTVNGMIQFMNDGRTKVTSAAATAAGYTSSIDLGKSSLFYSTATGDGYYLKYTWLGYTYNSADPTNTVPYLMPIPASKTAVSLYLNNNGYRLNQYFQ